MVPFPKNKISKGMIFAGCSFTWGQGLWYYSNMESLKNPGPNDRYGYHPGILTDPQLRFKDSMRFSRLVSNFFNSYDIVHPKNGGANDQIIRYWDTSLKTGDKNIDLPAFNPGDFDRVFPIDPSEISHIIFQLTHWTRDMFSFTVDGENFECPYGWVGAVEHKKYYDAFNRYLVESGLHLSEINSRLREQSIQRVKDFLMAYESMGIKTYILTWPNDYNDMIQNDAWISDRFIKINFNGSIYDSIEDLMTGNKNSTICEDYESFDEPPNDCHPSLKVNRYIGLSIINFIKNKEG